MKKQGAPSFLAGGDLRPFIVKIVIPALFLLSSMFFFGTATRPGGFVVPGVFAAVAGLLFYLCGLAQATPDCVWYRRFFHWERIEYEDIVACGNAIFPPGLGYLKLRRFVPPFGKLYFAPYAPSIGPWEQLRQSREFMQYIRVRMGKPPGSVPDQPLASTVREYDDTQKARVKRCSSFGGLAGGLIFFSRVFVGWPGPGFPPPIESGQPWYWQANLYWWHFCHRILDWPFNMIAIVMLLSGIVALRFNRAATSLAIALGALVGGLLARFFSA